MHVAAAKEYFLKNGKPHFLISGEIHYFRLDPRLWSKHLRLLKASGANTTSTYIPWEWHGYAEDRYDFTGKTHPGRNLLRYIELCERIGLDVIVKPGPYILAEYALHGLPRWLLQRSPAEARALDEDGKIIADEVFSYLSGEFLRETFLWYDQVMPLIARHQGSAGGPITMMQVCNEVGVFQWLSGKPDYSPTVIGALRKYLRTRYDTIDALNEMYGSRYRDFEEVDAPRGIITHRYDYRRYVDFHLFYRSYFAQYIDILVQRIRGYGIDVQLTHNIPGWIYGHASELPMLISTYTGVMRSRNDIAFGLDHIPEFSSFRNAHSDLACNAILKAVQPYAPVWAAEFQAGTREHFVPCDPRDMDLFYFASLAHGLRGFNYYMFSEGVNPKGRGYYGRSFYFQTPLSTQARPSSLYRVTKNFGGFINKQAGDLLASKLRADVCVGFYAPYFYTDLTSSQLLRETRLKVGPLGLSLDPRFIREKIFFNGLLRALQTLNTPYEVADLETTSPDDLLKYKQVWVISVEYMGAVAQELLAGYVRRGGHLVITPAIPAMDDYLRPCTLLRDEIGIEWKSAATSGKIDAFGLEEIYAALPVQQIYASSEQHAVAKTAGGDICGVDLRAGAGRVTALGFVFGYSTDDHLRLYEKVLALDRIRPAANVTGDGIQVVVRVGERNTYLFLLNYHNERKRVRVNSRTYVIDPISCNIVISPLKKKR